MAYEYRTPKSSIVNTDAISLQPETYVGSNFSINNIETDASKNDLLIQSISSNIYFLTEIYFCKFWFLKVDSIIYWWSLFTVFNMLPIYSPINPKNKIWIPEKKTIAESNDE